MSEICQFPGEVVSTRKIVHRNHTQWEESYYGLSSVLSVCLMGDQLIAAIDYYDFQVWDTMPFLVPGTGNTDLAKHLLPYPVEGVEAPCYCARYLLYHTVYMDSKTVDETWKSVIEQLTKETLIPGWND